MSIDVRRAQPARPRTIPVVVAVLGLVFAVLAILVGTRSAWLQDLDDAVSDRAFGLSTDHAWIGHLVQAIGDVFDTNATLLLLAVAVVYAFHRREPRVGLWVVVSGAVTQIGYPVLKSLFHRPRPVWDVPLDELGSWSFPSGHATSAGTVATVAVFLTILMTGRGWRRRGLVALWVVLGVAVAASRVFLGVHFLSDVVAGLCFGVAVPLVVWLLVMHGESRVPPELAAVTGTGRRRAAVVLNPAKVGDVDVFKQRVVAAAERNGWGEPLWFETSVEDPGAGQTLAALAREVDLVVAAGGDGTVRAVCEEAARTGVAVAILPHGTGNLLARNLGIPLNVIDALDTAFSGQDRAIDLASFAVDDEEPTSFLVMAGLGMDAAIMTGVDDDLKKKVGFLAYFVSGVKAARYPVMKVQISVDDGPFEKFRARTVVVGNVGFLQAGIPLLPEAEIDDGRLDVVALAPTTLLGWIAIGVRVMLRQKRTNEKLDRRTGRKVVIKAEKPTPMQLDGDPVGEGTEICAEVAQGVVLVRTPLGIAKP